MCYIGLVSIFLKGESMNRLFILSLVTMTTFNSFAITAKQGRDLEANYELVEIHEGDEYDCKSNIYIETTLDDSKKNIEQVDRKSVV